MKINIQTELDPSKSTMITSTQQVSKLFLLAASFYLAFKVWKLLLDERNLNHSQHRNSSQWAMELKNKENFEGKKTVFASRL